MINPTYYRAQYLAQSPLQYYSAWERPTG